MSRDLMTVAEIADELRVSKMTVYRLCETKQILSVRVGRSLRIDRRAFEDYLERQQRS